MLLGGIYICSKYVANICICLLFTHVYVIVSKYTVYGLYIYIYICSTWQPWLIAPVRHMNATEFINWWLCTMVPRCALKWQNQSTSRLCMGCVYRLSGNKPPIQSIKQKCCVIFSCFPGDILICMSLSLCTATIKSFGGVGGSSCYENQKKFRVNLMLEDDVYQLL